MNTGICKLSPTALCLADHNILNLSPLICYSGDNHFKQHLAYSWFHSTLRQRPSLLALLKWRISSVLLSLPRFKDNASNHEFPNERQIPNIWNSSHFSKTLPIIPSMQALKWVQGLMGYPVWWLADGEWAGRHHFYAAVLGPDDCWFGFSYQMAGSKYIHKKGGLPRKFQSLRYPQRTLCSTGNR